MSATVEQSVKRRMCTTDSKLRFSPKQTAKHRHGSVQSVETHIGGKSKTYPSTPSSRHAAIEVYTIDYNRKL